MIIYFSATGNSLWVARELGARLSLPYFAIHDAKALSAYEMGTDEVCVLVMPVHAWGPALPMLRFIEQMDAGRFAGHPLYAVCTCGDDCGWTHCVLQKSLREKGLELRATFSVQMPNTYILLPGFDVDTPSSKREKLEAAPTRVRKIAEMIRKGADEMKTLYRPGTCATLKTSLIYPARICPTRNIRIKPKSLPTWGDACVQCHACIHRCPHRAIECGNITQKKGRYVNPYVYKSKG